MTPPTQLVDQLVALTLKPTDGEESQNLRTQIEHLVEEVSRDAKEAFEAQIKVAMMEIANAKEEVAAAKAQAAAASPLSQAHTYEGPQLQAIQDTGATSILEDQLSAASAFRRLGLRPPEPLPFNGSNFDQKAVDFFLESMENFFTLEPTLTDSQKIQVAIMKFEPNGPASQWIRSNTKLYKVGEPQAPEWLRDWPAFCTMMSTRFGEPDSAETRISKLMEFVVLHSSDTTRDYAIRFFTLAEDTDLPETARKAMFRFGLRAEVRAAVAIGAFATLGDLVTSAVAVEEGLGVRRLALAPGPPAPTLHNPSHCTGHHSTPGPMEIDATKCQTHQAALAAQSGPLRRGQQQQQHQCAFVGASTLSEASAQEPGWGKQMFTVALVTLSQPPSHLASVSLLALLDNGSEADLVNEEIVNKLKIPKVPLKVPRKLVGVHPQMTISSTHSVTLNINIAGHQEVHPFVVAPMGHDMVLGQPWLSRHDPLLSYRLLTITFNSNTCMQECLRYPAPLQVPLLDANGHHAVTCVDDTPQQLCPFSL